MSNVDILVTGSTGRTGLSTVKNLRKAGAGVRALAHREGPKADELRALGAEVAIGDFLNLDDMAAALAGVKNAYFCFPVAPGLLDATVTFALAAKEAGVEAIVNMSQMPARREAKSRASQQHWASERIFDWSGIPTTHLRPTFFAEWLTVMVDPGEMRRTGKLKLPMGEGRHAPIASEDQARLIAAILQDAKPHAGKTYKLYGPTQMTHHDIAAAMGKVLGRNISYQAIPFEEFEKSRLQTIRSSDHVKQHLNMATIDYQNGIFEGEDGIIRQVTGEPPMTVESYIEKNKAYFA